MEGEASFLRRAFSIVTIEPAIFLTSLGFGFQSIISQNLVIDKVCHVNLDYNATVCKNLAEFKLEQAEVQKLAATLTMYLSILTAVPAIISSLFLGPWSDVNGRKPLMILPMVGTCITQFIYIINTFLAGIKAEFILLASLGSLLGGFTCFLVGIYSFISDISENRGRTSRIAFLDLFVFLGFPIGIFASGPIFKYGGYYASFGLAAGFTLLGLLYVLFFIKDTRGPYCDSNVLNAGEPRILDIRSPISIYNLWDVFKTCFKTRPNYGRPIILLLIGAMLFNLSTINSGNLTYLYTRLKFNWTEQNYSIWASCSAILSSLVTFSAMPILSYKMKIHDTLIGMIGAVFGVAASLVNAFSDYPWMLILGSVIGLLSTAPAIVIRSFLSKVTPANELGKIFSLVASLEAAVPLIIAPIMTLVYKSSLEVFPGAIFLVSAGLFFMVSVHLSIVFVLVRKSGQLNYGDEETETIIDNEELPQQTESSDNE